jgi:hypothetical protein
MPICEDIEDKQTLLELLDIYEKLLLKAKNNNDINMMMKAHIEVLTIKKKLFDLYGWIDK